MSKAQTGGKIIQIRSVKQYINDFIAEGLKNLTQIRDEDIISIKKQMLEAFRKEIFEQVVDKLGPEAAALSRDDLAKIDKVHNILVQSFRKWRRICILCTELGFGSYFQLEDLRDTLTDEDEAAAAVVIPDDEGEDVTDQLDEPPVYLEKAGETEVPEENEDQSEAV